MDTSEVSRLTRLRNAFEGSYSVLVPCTCYVHMSYADMSFRSRMILELVRMHMHTSTWEIRKTRYLAEFKIE